MERKGSVLCWSMLALTVAAPLAAVHAEEKISYEMASYSDWPGGEEIAARDYDAAIAKARRHAWLDDTTALVATTNLCVAHTVKRELPAADCRLHEGAVARAASGWWDARKASPRERNSQGVAESRSVARGKRRLTRSSQRLSHGCRIANGARSGRAQPRGSRGFAGASSRVGRRARPVVLQEKELRRGATPRRRAVQRCGSLCAGLYPRGDSAINARELPSGSRNARACKWTDPRNARKSSSCQPSVCSPTFGSPGCLERRRSYSASP